MNAACSSGLSGGGAWVRVATGWPTRVKNSSCPAGAHKQSSRDGVSVELVNACGAFAGTLIVSPLAGNDRLAPEGDLDLAVEDGEHLFEVMSMRWRPAAGRHVHIDQGVLASGVASGNEDRVRVADQPDVRQVFVLVGARNGQRARGVVGWDGGSVGSHDSPQRCGADG